MRSHEAAVLTQAPPPHPEQGQTHHHSVFRRFAQATSKAVGTPAAFCLALGVVLTWGITGPLFHYSDSWQLVINTGTTILTFLMIFLVQHTQTRETTAVSLKLDELIRAVDAARNEMLTVEDLDDEDIDALQVEFQRLASTHTVERGPKKR
jgi:low affinity Fe/Cu permease